MRSLLVAVALSAAGFAPFASSAATLNLTGAEGAAIAAGNSDTAVYGGNAAFGGVTFAANPRGSDLTHSGAGLGIDCSGWSLSCTVDTSNQIDFPEVLGISFSTPKFVTSVNISNLFSQTFNLGRLAIVIEDAGSIQGAGFSVPFSAGNADESGGLLVAINAWASTIRFVPVAGLFEDFSLAAVSIDETRAPTAGPGTPGTTSPIPEPSSVMMMMLGGAVVLFSIRKVAF